MERIKLVTMKILITCTALLFANFASTQIKELKKAQDTRKEYVDPGKVSIKNFDKLSFVNPFIGTGGHGHTYPGASSPFGMIQLSPDTRHEGWDGCSGYHYSDSILYGFSHTHLSGTGVPDYCDLLLVPQSGKPRIDPGYSSEKGYGSKFSHTQENASPGYYDVKLLDNDIDVRLTVTDRAGFHEYTFNNKKGKRFILIDLDHRDKLLSSTINVLDKKNISGSRISESWASKQHFFFHLELDTPFQKAHIFKKKGRNKLLLVFPKSTKRINVKVGISAVDTDGARANLKAEIPNWSFEVTHAKAKVKWKKELDKIYYYTEDKEVMHNFYTALYHSYLNPNLFNDVDGRYRGRDGEVHQLTEEDGRNYTVFSLWDTYRATHPLFTLTQVERTNEFVNTFLRQYKQGGDLPVWELAGNETECMIGYHSVSVISDAYMKGIKGYDATEAMYAMLATSNFDEYGKRAFQSNGYINTSDEPESVSKTLEYSYDNFCIAQMAGALQKDAGIVELPFGKYAKTNTQYNFVNLFDPQTKFMRGRRSGQWFAPFDPSEVNFNYTEANSWQYSLYAPHAVGILSDLIGGKDSLETWLDRLFTTDMNLSGRHQVDITGLIGQYAHGNEPSHHIAYLYNYTNSPEKTQFYIDSILYEMYTNAPDGLSGNEDCGQMSSWYILSSLGLYQIAPGNPYYEIGRPLMDESMLQFENGKRLKINAINNSKENKYVQQLHLNGKPLHRNYISHEELISGGELIFVMGDSPVLSRDTLAHAPTLSKLPESFIPTPYFEQSDRVFEENMSISINMINADSASIYYTLDGTDPSASETSAIYKQPIVISESTTIKAYAMNKHGKSSTISNDFIKKNKNLSIELKSTYANQYAAVGDFTLIDGIRGNNEYRTGDWQGYWAQDVVAEITFKASVKISEIGIGCLSDMKSWIFLPRQVEFQVSYDGETFEPGIVVNIEKEVQEDQYAHHTDIVGKTETDKAIKKIRVIARSFGKCPEWHLGNGNDTWLFVDEIFFH